MRSSAGPGGQPPKVVIMSPPKIKETAQAKSWGFVGSAAKSVATAVAYEEVAKKLKVPIVNMHHPVTLTCIPVGRDGVHFPAEAAGPIGSTVAAAVRVALGRS